MRLRIFEAASNREAMAAMRQTLGPDAVIVATHEDEHGVRLTAAVGSVDDNVGELLKPPPVPLDGRLDGCLRHHGVPVACRSDLLAAAERSRGRDDEHLLTQALEECYRFEALKFEKPVLLVGLPGSGKTIATAKLAARFCLDGKPVDVLSTDTQRAGGTAQLRLLLEAMQLPLGEIADAAALRRHMASTVAGQPLIIDSCGFDPYRGDELVRIAELVAAAKAEPVLVAAASTIAEDALEAAENLRALGIRKAIVSKLDLARRYGVVPALAHAGLSLTEAGFSPLIGSALTPLTPAGLARLLSRRAATGDGPTPDASRSAAASAPAHEECRR